MVSEYESDYEERNSEKNGDTRDKLNKVMDFFGDGSFSCIETGSQSGNSTHDGVVTARNYNTFGGT